MVKKKKFILCHYFKLFFFAKLKIKPWIQIRTWIRIKWGQSSGSGAKYNVFRSTTRLILSSPDGQGVTECYECQPKPHQKTFPGCTIRNTPSEPIHCIVWAKHLFNQVTCPYTSVAEPLEPPLLWRRRSREPEPHFLRRLRLRLHLLGKQKRKALFFCQTLLKSNL